MTLLLDAVLIVVLIVALGNGYRAGFFRTVGSLAGFVAGAFAAVFMIPVIGRWVPDADWRGPATLLAALVLVFGGLGLGQAIGNAVGSGVRRTPLRLIERLGGSVAGVAATALVMSMIGSSIVALGIPLVSPPLAGSSVLRTVDRLTPPPVSVALAQLRSAVIDGGIPQIVDAFGGQAPTTAEVETGTPDLQAAARSVVRISGTAYSCGQNQSGSGFVVAPGRVVTNAHVVAGVDAPLVETAEDGAVTGRIVYFDPIDDLAVIAVESLATSPLPLAGALDDGTPAVVDGYPLGGPFVSKPASVISTGTLSVADIYGASETPREVYTLASDVQPGNSGGPLLTTAGAVAGVVFAKGASTQNVGYAMTTSELAPVASAATALSAPVDSGACVTG